MSIYDDFRDWENCTVVVNSKGTGVLNDNMQMIYPTVEQFSGTALFYEMTASEKIARSQIQKEATHQLILDPLKVTNTLDETMSAIITTATDISLTCRIVTAKYPLNKDEAIILELKES